MKLTSEDLQTLRRAAAVADAQKELVENEQRRAQGRPAVARIAAPVLAAVAVALMVTYLSVLAVTPDQETASAPVFLSGDIERPPPRG